jgi:hypothetical protein
VYRERTDIAAGKFQGIDDKTVCRDDHRAFLRRKTGGIGGNIEVDALKVAGEHVQHQFAHETTAIAVRQSDAVGTVHYDGVAMRAAASMI